VARELLNRRLMTRALGVVLAGVTLLTRTVPALATTVTLLYDGNGARLKKTTPTGVTVYPFGDDLQVKGGVVTKYIACAGSIVAERTGTTTHWVHTDHLDSVQAVSDSAGAQVQRYSYHPYGDRLATATSYAEALSFTGQRQDETGLFYLHARYFESSLGRFVSADPTRPTSANIGLNRYAYGLNDPANQRDTNGLGPDLPDIPPDPFAPNPVATRSRAPAPAEPVWTPNEMMVIERQTWAQEKRSRWITNQPGYAEQARWWERILANGLDWGQWGFHPILNHTGAVSGFQWLFDDMDNAEAMRRAGVALEVDPTMRNIPALLYAAGDQASEYMEKFRFTAGGRATDSWLRTYCMTEARALREIIDSMQIPHLETGYELSNMHVQVRVSYQVDFAPGDPRVVTYIIEGTSAAYRAGQSAEEYFKLHGEKMPKR
jgi:RHS repeat-associated protein